jgi:hypothetical protein
MRYGGKRKGESEEKGFLARFLDKSP